MRARSSKWLLIFLIPLIALAAAVLTTIVRHEEGYFSPVISPDGRFAYFIKRETSGLVIGLGYEFFTPPAHAFLWRDRFELCRVKMDGSGFEVVHTWPPSPLEGRTLQQYRGRIFSAAQATLRFEDGQLEYEIVVRDSKQPTSESFAVRRRWDPKRCIYYDDQVAWKRGDAIMGSGEDALREPWEVLAVRGRETYPCAVIAHNDQTAEIRILKKTGVCDRLYTDGIRWEHVAGQSRRAEVRRYRHIRDLNDAFFREGLKQGLNEASAILAASRKLQELGYYPKPPQVVARPISSEQAKAAQPLFRITEMEFKVGLFNDIEQAIATPGKEVEKSMGDYIIHDHYDTSRRLNSFLASGAKKFFVERSGRIYEIAITERTPAVR